MKGPQAFGGRALLFVGTLLLGLGLLEVGLRAGGRYAVSAAAPLGLPGLAAAGESFSRPDDLLIYAIAPLARTYDWYAIDAHGFRTPEFSERKAPGTFRIVVTGDSTTFGLGVLEEQRWSSLLRRALSGLCGDVRAIEVINAGVPGYSTLQDRLQTERDLLPLQPDLLVLLVTAGNDATRVEGPDDAEIVRRQTAPGAFLARLRVARMLGLGLPVYGAPPAKADADSTTARPRVAPAQAEDNLRAIADLLPRRVVLGIFQSQEQRHQSPDVDAIASRVAAVAAERGLPLADVRPRIEPLLPFPLYLDSIHPTPAGHALIARAMLEAVLPRLDLPPARAAWATAFLEAQAGQVPREAALLRGPGAPPRFSELLSLYADAPALNARLQQQDAALPAALLAWDPLLGRECRARSAARRLLASPRSAQDLADLDVIRAFLRPEDPLLACFADEHDLVAADEALRSLARALIVFGAELGLPPLRADLRRGQAALAADAATAVPLLDAVLALEPLDDEARSERAWCLRRAGRRDEAHAEFATLAAGSGPPADLARGLLAFEARDLAAAEGALRAAIAAAPASGYAHQLLGQTLLLQDRLDDATRELLLASVLLGTSADVPALLAQIETRRRELGDAAH